MLVHPARTDAARSAYGTAPNLVRSIRRPSAALFPGLVAAALLVFAALPAAAQDARSILATMAEKQAERWASVDNYSIEQAIEGAPIPVPVYFTKTTAGGFTTFRRVPFNEWAKKGSGAEGMEPEHYEIMADGYDMIGQVHRDQADPMTAGLVTWVTDDAAAFMRAAAEAERSGEAYADDDPDAANVQGMAAFGRRARLIGRETVDGRDAFLLRADDLSDVSLEQPEGGDAEFTLLTGSLWIDAEHYVPLRMVMDGEIVTSGGRGPVTMELRLQDYQQSGPLYEPGRQVMRMSGLMQAMATDPEQKKELEEARKEMEKARAEMEKMEAELAKMPASVRGMVEEQMQKSMQQMEMMMNDGVIESVIHQKVLGVNQGPPLDWRPAVGG